MGSKTCKSRVALTPIIGAAVAVLITVALAAGIYAYTLSVEEHNSVKTGLLIQSIQLTPTSQGAGYLTITVKNTGMLSIENLTVHVSPAPASATQTVTRTVGSQPQATYVDHLYVNPPICPTVFLPYCGYYSYPLQVNTPSGDTVVVAVACAPRGFTGAACVFGGPPQCVVTAVASLNNAYAQMAVCPGGSYTVYAGVETNTASWVTLDAYAVSSSYAGGSNIELFSASGSTSVSMGIPAPGGSYAVVGVDSPGSTYTAGSGWSTLFSQPFMLEGATYSAQQASATVSGWNTGVIWSAAFTSTYSTVTQTITSDIGAFPLPLLLPSSSSTSYTLTPGQSTSAVIYLNNLQAGGQYTVWVTGVSGGLPVASPPIQVNS